MDSKTLKPVYLAVEPQFLKEEFSKLMVAKGKTAMICIHI
jgi:hypothetical protein